MVLGKLFQSVFQNILLNTIPGYAYLIYVPEILMGLIGGLVLINKQFTTGDAKENAVISIIAYVYSGFAYMQLMKYRKLLRKHDIYRNRKETELYNQKNVNYIQIGDAGLFYMGKDILNLGVPKFDGESQIEMRIKRDGKGRN